MASAVSSLIYSNIYEATPRREGFERHSKPNFARFLDIAKGSCGEVRTKNEKFPAFFTTLSPFYSSTLSLFYFHGTE